VQTIDVAPAVIGELTITCPSPGEYRIRAREGELRELGKARESLRARLLEDGEASEEVNMLFVGEIGLEALFADQSAKIRSLGWEALLLPNEKRRKVHLPAGVTVTPDISHLDRESLVGIHHRAAHLLDTPYLDLKECMLIRRDGEIVGWVPIWRVTASTSVIRVIALHPSIHADEERRRTHLRLAVYLQAVESQCAQWRSVLSWMPDDDDPVNELKISVSGHAQSTHWMAITVRRDLEPTDLN